MNDSIIPKNTIATKAVAGTGLGAIVLALFTYVISNRDATSVHTEKLRVLENRSIEQKVTNKELRETVGGIKVSIEGMRSELKNVSVSVNDIKEIVKR